MEVIYSVPVIALVLYLIGYSIGFAPSDDDKPSLHGVGAMLTGGFFCLVLWAMAQGTIRAPGAGAVLLIFFSLFAALFLFGLGRFLGTMVSIWFAKGILRRVMVLATTGLPAMAVAWTIYSTSKVEAALQAEQAAARAALQSGTYEARFGAHEIAFPGVPVFTVIHPCRTRGLNCTTRFWIAAGWNKRKEGPLEIVSFEVNTNPTALQELEPWCAEKPAFGDALWCQFTPDDEMRLKRLEDLRGVENERTTSCMQIYTGDFTCRASHDLADGIVAVLHTLTDTENSGRALIDAKRMRAEAVWARLTEAPRP